MLPRFWGSRGRRFKSCHPDGKQQVRGRFGESRGGLFPVWGPKCSNGCGNGAHSHQPIAAESRWTAERAPLGGGVAVRVPGDRDGGVPKYLRDGMQWHAGREHVRGECLNVCRPTPLMPKALAAVLIARSEFLGSTAVPLSVVNTRPVSTQVEAALSRSTAWLALTDRNSATVVGERGTSRRERSVLGSLMTRCPLARESVPRTRRRPLVRSTSDQRRASASPRRRPVAASRRNSGAYCESS